MFPRGLKRLRRAHPIRHHPPHPNAEAPSARRIRPPPQPARQHLPTKTTAHRQLDPPTGLGGLDCGNQKARSASITLMGPHFATLDERADNGLTSASGAARIVQAQPAELPTPSLQALKQRAHQLLESQRSLQQQNQDLAAERLGFESERVQQATQHQELSAERDALQAERNSLTAHIQELTAQRDSIQQQWETLQTTVEDLQGQLSGQCTQTAEQSQQREVLQARVEKLQANVEELQRQLSEQSAQTAEQSQHHDELQVEQERLFREAEAQKSQYETLQADLLTATKEYERKMSLLKAYLAQSSASNHVAKMMLLSILGSRLSLATLLASPESPLKLEE